MRYVTIATQPRHLLIKFCRENVFRISNLIKSNRQNKLKLGVGFKVKARATAYFTKLGWRCGCIFVAVVCVRGWVYIFIWLEGWECIGKEGEEKLHHYIIFVTLSSLVHEKILSHQPDEDD